MTLNRNGQHMLPEDRLAVQERFLTLLRDSGLISESCRQTPIAHSTLVYWKQHDEDFKRRYDEARELADDKLRDELEVARRDGLLETEVEFETHGGVRFEKRRVEKRKQDARVLLGAAQARLEEYRPTQKVELSGPGGGALAAIAPAEARGIVRLLEGARELGLLPAGEVTEGETTNDRD